MVEFNVLRGLLQNKYMVDSLTVPCQIPGPHSQTFISNPAVLRHSTILPVHPECSGSLAPTTLQMSVNHFSWIDSLPCPVMRENIIRHEFEFSHADFVKDLVGSLMNLQIFYRPPSLSRSDAASIDMTAQTGLMIRGEPYLVSSWEMTPGFIRKSGWMSVASFIEETPRQQSWEQLQAAATAGCYICRWIYYMDRHRKSSTQPRQYNSSYKMELAGDDLTYSSFVRIKIDGAYDLLLGFLPVTEAEPFYSSPLTFEPSESMISEDSKKWISECKTNHEQCRVPNPAFRPTRLVEIINLKQARLILSAMLPIDAEVSYVAFSHCWGKVKRLELEAKSASQLFAGFNTAALPQTYKDAIAICIQLGYRYIWIDSLCIFQDSRSDWQQEATMMGSVYANADLNLRAASAVDSSQGMFPDRDHNLLTPMDITSQWTGEKERRLRLVPLDLFYADVWWQCPRKLACETFPNGVPNETGVSRYWKAEAGGMKEKAVEMTSGDLWLFMTAMYANTALTKEEDRLMAFAGAVQAFRASHKSRNRYAAGFWYSQLPWSLAWANSGRKTTTTRSDTYKAPSWSWLSLDGPYELFLSTEGNYLEENELEKCSVEDLWLHYVDDSHDTGLLRGGAIQLRGHLIGPATKNPNGQLSEGFVTDMYCEDFVETDRVKYWCGDDKVELEMRFDEEDPSHTPIVSYLDNLQPDHKQGLVEGATRQAMTLADADGFIYLFQTHSELDHEMEKGLVEGIILYQPPHQVGVFHRIGCYRVLSSDIKLGRLRTLGDRYPRRSILIL
ncbi:unnamed protein product [Fusarium equiseti]|uniref:Heterokaryon incompatibility domain-containing protein n=1 Tax=Fusarium equiseti TaxID=61235 RepID=A0A8J2IJ74_FUSEQ|nr:unnamed protein product [Fusarium equiseti]